MLQLKQQRSLENMNNLNVDILFSESLVSQLGPPNSGEWFIGRGYGA